MTELPLLLPLVPHVFTQQQEIEKFNLLFLTIELLLCIYIYMIFNVEPITISTYSHLI